MFCKIVEQMFYKVAGLGHRRPIYFTLGTYSHSLDPLSLLFTYESQHTLHQIDPVVLTI